MAKREREREREKNKDSEERETDKQIKMVKRGREIRVKMI